MAWDTAKAEEIKTDMDSVLDNESIDIEEVKLKGMTVRLGGRVVKLEVTEEVSVPEDDIREEYTRIFNEKLGKIRETLNEKFSEMSYMVEQNRQDYEEKERELQDRLASANIMPEITYTHARQGLSVVKKSNRERGADVLTWLYQGVYWPKYVDGNPIEPKYAKRLISPVTLEISTKGNRVSGVVVRKTIGLGKFEHYHSMNESADCWGQWHHSSTWETPDDILKIAREALAVLENVNTSSPGNRNPSGLPRLDTLQNHVLRGEEARNVRYDVSRADERAGISTDDETVTEQRVEGGGGVWST